MKQTVYVDVLVSVNIIVDYFLLHAAAVVCGRKRNRIRLCLAACSGGVGSLSLLLPPMPPAVNVLLALVMASLMAFIAFGTCSMRTYMMTMLVTFALSSAYSGAAVVLWCLMPDRRITVNNGAVYIGIEPLTLVLTTAVLYALMSLFSRKVSGMNTRRTKCTLTVASDGRRASVEAVVDTGNVLTEPFSGLPVILVPAERIVKVAPQRMNEFLSGGCACAERRVRAVPYASAGGKGVLAAFIPDSIVIETGGRKITNVKAYIAPVPDGRIGDHALINPDAADF